MRVIGILLFTYLCLIQFLSVSGSTCPENFNSARCRRQITQASQLLHEACTSTPFVSGCSIHRFCHQSNSTSDSCQPLHALISVCQEFPELSPCSQLSRSCSDADDLLECPDVIDLDLPNTESSYEAMQQICTSHYMTGCEHCRTEESFSNAISNHSAFADACMDPFGTLAQTCMQMDMIPCDVWKEWCNNQNNSEIPGICENTNEDRSSPSPMPHDHSSHDHSSHDHSSHEHNMESSRSPEVALQTAEVDVCVQDPTGDGCGQYEYPEDSILADIIALCGEGPGSMPWMPGCSLWQDCRDRNAHSNYCSSFTLLATLCEDMPRMAGCRNYATLCGEGSLVPQCRDHPAIPWAPTTMRTQREIIEACSDHFMPQCNQCPNQGASCGHTLRTMSELCNSMPSMSFCGRYRRFCSATDDQFASYCDLDSHDFLPPMRMYFHTGQRDIILFRDWIPESTIGYVLSFFAVVLLGILVQALKAMRTRLEGFWHRQILAESQGDCSTCVEMQPAGGCDPNCAEECRENCGQVPTSNTHTTPRAILQRNAIRAIITGVMGTLDFALMLVAMTFNVGLFIAVITGLTLGVFIFGHVPEKDYTKNKKSLAGRAARQPYGETHSGCCS